MPLLGRHKTQASSQASGQQAPQQRGTQNQQVCESPIFGTRRQLPSSSSPDLAPGKAPVTGAKRTPSPAGSGANLTSDEAGQLLGSIPQQITRQQIHYAFSIIDLNKDGMIDVRDLSQMLANLGVPIDEAILSHIMSKLSKRGDHRISESEFLNWISNFIQISDSQPAAGTGDGLTRGHSELALGRSRKSQPGSSGKSKVGRSATTGAGSLIAEPAPAEGVSRNRRGSGSGLALMRSLSASAAGSGSSSGSSRTSSTGTSGSSEVRPGKARQQEQAQPKTEAVSEVEDLKNDLKAAFLVFDVDGDGFITLDEVRAGLKLLGESWTPAEVRQVFSRCKSSTDLSGRPAGHQQQQRINIDDFVQLLL